MFSPKLRKISHPCKYAKGGVIPAAEKDATEPGGEFGRILAALVAARKAFLCNFAPESIKTIHIYT